MKFKWKAWAGIVFIVTIVVFNIAWAWSIVFIAWVIPDLISGNTFLFEQVSRKESPITYWTIMALWISLSSLILLVHFYPELFTSV